MILGSFAGGQPTRTNYNQTDPNKSDYLIGRESVANHIASKENPHGVTAAQVGAAPGGYGLGGEATIVNDLNDATACGWYYFGKGCANAPFDYGIMLVLNRLDTQIVQCAFEPAMNGEMIACVRAGRKNGTWYSWEAINPSMSVNAETRTTERYNGKIVYAKLVNFGAMPNATSKTVAYRGNGSTGVVSLTAMLSDGCCVSGGVCADKNFSNVDTFVLDSTKYNVRITTTSNWSSVSAYVLVKYTLD